ncbi:hypothetical protein CONLIGDRAFT_636207 [Coniochaeta ligniaria NRRL 30616]|uniref:Uncharacterized protein n=1 Tax=Coniochaeta ligniaria NRRL 30616 TaxID=1408157 RepID=A0A1J7IVJ0_9PEZI|nr:hypothetical protein CONLIGDRAFT_636207 [Coniochaeta ligniaria NRRL 30616]
MPAPASDTSNHVQLPPGLAKRFYGSIILLNTLNGCFPQARHTASTPSDLKREVGSDLAGFLCCFVDKLAQICDSKHGGDTVTSIAILQPGCIEYRLSSNSRSEKQFRDVKTYLAGILDSLGSVEEEALADDSLVAELCSAILYKVLVFNRWRVKVYVTGFLQHVEFCIGSCDDDGRPEARLAARHFRDLQTIAKAAEEQWPTASFAKNCHTLLYAIKERYKEFERFLRTMARDGRGPSNETPWTELRHAIGRLHSYSIAMPVFVEARREWPELFDKGVEITHVPSARRCGNPVRMKQSRCTGGHILRSLNADDGVVHAYRESAVHYKTMGVDLDANILEQVKAENYTTVVHAELNVANSISLEDQDPDAEEPVRFFLEHELKERGYDRYIGSSKPTCLLCSMWLKEHPGGFGCRPTYGNLYTKWRAPDVSDDEHGELFEARRLILEGMVTKLTSTISATIRTRTGIRRRHDSRQTPTDPFRSLRSISVRTTAGRSYVASEVGLDVDERTTEDESSQSIDADDDDTKILENLMEHVHVVTGIASVEGHAATEQSGHDEDDDEDSDSGGASL